MLSDELWSKLENVLLQQAIYHKPDLRMTVEGMLCKGGADFQLGRAGRAGWAVLKFFCRTSNKGRASFISPNCAKFRATLQLRRISEKHIHTHIPKVIPLEEKI